VSVRQAGGTLAALALILTGLTGAAPARASGAVLARRWLVPPSAGLANLAPQP